MAALLHCITPLWKVPISLQRFHMNVAVDATSETFTAPYQFHLLWKVSGIHALVNLNCPFWLCKRSSIFTYLYVLDKILTLNQVCNSPKKSCKWSKSTLCTLCPWIWSNFGNPTYLSIQKRHMHHSWTVLYKYNRRKWE